MYVRDAKNREEVWLLDRLEEFGFEDAAFRSRDYVLAIDEPSREKIGFGRLRVHRTGDGEVCEVTNLGVLEDFRGNGAGVHILERLLETASTEGFERVYALSPAPSYLEQFGFEPVDPETLPQPLQHRHEAIRETHPDAMPAVVDIEEFRVPRRLRRRFGSDDREDADSEDRPEDFGIDPETATYKYDVSD
ncbi:MAG: GNAT family N-acetyltransferase [Halodesulfurarchaeum sp.]